MIDDFSILFSTLTVAWVIWRAVVLSRSLPWFKPPAKTDQLQHPPQGAQPAMPTQRSRRA